MDMMHKDLRKRDGTSFSVKQQGGDIGPGKQSPPWPFDKTPSNG